MQFIKIKQPVLLFLVGLGLILVNQIAVARILSDQEASQANNAALNAETEVFDRIGMGIALSIARCRNQAGCEPSVDEGELEQLIETLDSRISTLVTRQEESEEDYGDILNEYVNQREEYLQYQDDLNNLTAGLTEEPESIEEDSFAEDVSEEPAEPPAATGEGKVDFSIFEDADEELQ